MKKARKLSALLLALVMVFSLSATAFAAETEQVEIRIFIDTDEDGEFEETQTTTFTLAGNDTVESVIKAKYPQDDKLSDWSGSWMTSLLGRGSEPYVADSSCFDEYGFYVGTDTKLDEHAAEHGGVMMDGSMLAPGYYFMNDNYTMYLGSDWTFKVDYADDNVDGPVTPGRPDASAPDGFLQYTMGQTSLEDGDVLYLYYTFAPTFFLM